MTTYHGQALQDKFVLNVLKKKKSGTFLELGANDAIDINNTYTLEKDFGWSGIMIEFNEKHLKSFKEHRKNSVHVIADATKIDYKKLLKDNNMPENIDYLQIDLDAGNGSTMEALEKLDNEVFDKYKFATVTFEHDYYCAGDYKSTREKSREIFKKRGYVMVFDDIHDRNPEVVYEDWYVHPDLVDMEYVNNLRNNNISKYIENNLTDKSIDWQSICYEDDIKITYTVQVCNESRELFSLLNFLIKTIDWVDNIHVVVDSLHKTEKVQKVIDYFKDRISVFERPFDSFYKNAQFHKKCATGEYIFGLDADEMPQELLIKNIKRIISTTKCEIIYIPRINIHPGMTQEFLHTCKQFKVNEVGWINWPDFQGRIYKNAEYINWSDEIHTKLGGSDKVIAVKPDPQLALWHIKSMEKQQSRWVENKSSDKGYCDGGFDIRPPSEDNLYDQLM